MKHRDYDLLFNYGTQAQRAKLDRDSHKPDFLDHSLRQIENLLREEVKELRQELSLWRNVTYTSAKSEKALLTGAEQEFADIANFAHMGILKCKYLKGELDES